MTNKNPLIFTAIGFVVVAFGLYHFVIGPKRKDADDLKAKVTEAQDKLDSARALLASNQAARDSYRADYSTVVRLGKAVPTDDDVRSLVVQLDHAAKRTRVNFDAISVDANAAAAPAPAAGTGATAPMPPGVTVGPAGFPVMPFSFTFRGEFFRLGKFFQRLNAFVKAANGKLDVRGRLLTVDGLKLEPDTTGFPNIKATVKATTYLVSPLEGATGGATAAGPAGAPAAGAAPSDDTSIPTTTATGAIR